MSSGAASEPSFGASGLGAPASSGGSGGSGVSAVSSISSGAVSSTSESLGGRVRVFGALHTKHCLSTGHLKPLLEMRWPETHPNQGTRRALGLIEEDSSNPSQKRCILAVTDRGGMTHEDAVISVQNLDWSSAATAGDSFSVTLSYCKQRKQDKLDLTLLVNGIEVMEFCFTGGHEKKLVPFFWSNDTENKGELFANVDYLLASEMMNLSTSTTGNINSLRLLWALRLVDDSVGALLQEAPLPRSLIWGTRSGAGAEVKDWMKEFQDGLLQTARPWKEFRTCLRGHPLGCTTSERSTAECNGLSGSSTCSAPATVLCSECNFALCNACDKASQFLIGDEVEFCASDEEGAETASPGGTISKICAGGQVCLDLMDGTSHTCEWRRLKLLELPTLSLSAARAIVAIMSGSNCLSLSDLKAAARRNNDMFLERPCAELLEVLGDDESDALGSHPLVAAVLRLGALAAWLYEDQHGKSWLMASMASVSSNDSLGLEITLEERVRIALSLIPHEKSTNLARIALTGLTRPRERRQERRRISLDRRRLPGDKCQGTLLAQICAAIDGPVSLLPSIHESQWWEVSYRGERGQDAGGLFRDSISSTVQQLAVLAKPQSDAPCPLFVLADSSVEDSKLIPNPACRGASFDKIFTFLGTLMGACARTSCSPQGKEVKMALHFPAYFWALLAGDPSVCWDDVASEHESLRNWLEVIERERGVVEEDAPDRSSNTDPVEEISDEPLYFVLYGLQGQPVGRPPVEIPLQPNGNRIMLTPQNRQDFVDLSRAAHVKVFDHQVACMRRGLAKMVPEEVLALWGGHGLRLAVSGKGTCSVEDLRSHITFNGVDRSLQEHFWTALAQMDDTQRAKLLRFATGSVVPTRFSVGMGRSDPSYLPDAHTCSREIEIPPYRNAQEMYEKLTIAIEEQTFQFT